MVKEQKTSKNIKHFACWWRVRICIIGAGKGQLQTDKAFFSCSSK